MTSQKKTKNNNFRIGGCHMNHYLNNEINLNKLTDEDFENLNGSWIEINTNVVDFNGDSITLFANKQGTKYVLGDYGYFINELEMLDILDMTSLENFLSKEGFYIYENHICIDFDYVDDLETYKYKFLDMITNLNDLFSL